MASLKIFGSEASNSNDARCDKTGKTESTVVNDPDPFICFSKELHRLQLRFPY